MDCTGYRIKKNYKTSEKTKIKIFSKLYIILVYLAWLLTQGNKTVCSLIQNIKKNRR